MSRLDLSVGQRLAIGFVVIALLILTLGGIVLVSVSRITELRRVQNEVITPREKAAGDLESAIYQQAIAFRNYAITNSPADLQAFRLAQENLADRMERIAALPKTSAGETLFAEIVPLMAAHQQFFESFFKLAREAGDREVMRREEARISENRKRLLQRVDAFANLQTKQSEDSAQVITDAVAVLQNTLIVITILILVASMLTTWIVARSVREPAIAIVAAAEAIREGDFAAAVALENPGGDQPRRHPARDELREAARVFGRMASALKRREDRLSAHSQLSAVLGTSLDPRQVATEALREISKHVGAEVGAVYLSDGDAPELRVLTTIALDGELPGVPFGSGVPGEAAAGRRTICVRDIPADTPFAVRLGFDALPPRCVVASPMIVNDRVVGVALLASIHELDDEAIRFIENSSRQLAITLDNALGHVRIAALAADLQGKNETLQAQNEELQAQSEELQAQGEELQARSEELQAQQEELQAQSDELHAQNEELVRNTDLLLEQQKTLVDAEEQKNRFLAVLGHELRNPLAAIRSAIGLLANGVDEAADPQSSIRGVLKRQTAHLARLLDDLLDIGRITRGKIDLTRHPIELGAAVERCIRTIGANGDATAQITFKSDDEVWVDADETRIEQIVMNLLTNSIKFTPVDGRISVEVGREGSGALLRVKDTGRGIEAELLPRVFDFFVQGDALQQVSKRGLGVGLTLVKNLVELHGGAVAVESPGVGKGTTMIARLPALAGPPAPVVMTPVNTPAIKRSIVLVEDNADIRHMMRLLLSRAGHTVSEAEDGPGGVDTVTRVKPDIALVDLDLPGFDGCEVARRVRLDPQCSSVRLIAVSGFGRPEDRERALASGFDDHLVKPLDFDRLTLTLNAAAAPREIEGDGRAMRRS